MCARREAGAHRPAPFAPARPDPRPGRVRRFRLLPALALLPGALFVTVTPVQAQTPKVSIQNLQLFYDDGATNPPTRTEAQITPNIATGTFRYSVKVLPGTSKLKVRARWSNKASADHLPANPKPWLRSVTYNNLSDGKGGLRTQTFTVCYTALAMSRGVIWWATGHDTASQSSNIIRSGEEKQTRPRHSADTLMLRIEHEVWFLYWTHAGDGSGGGNRATERVVGTSKTNCPDSVTEVSDFLTPRPW